MSKQENLIIMLNKLRTAKTVRNLEKESNAIYEDLTKTRAELGQALDKRTEEMQEEMLNILGTAIVLMSKGKNDKAFDYLKNEYKTLKKDLFEDDQSNEQIIIKIFK